MRPDQFLTQFCPENVLKQIDESIIGQDEAKRALVAAVWWNLYRAVLIDAGHDPRTLPPKQNVLLIGPSGIGKTALAKAVAAEFDVPWVTTSAPGYSAAGYTGADVDDMLGLLAQAANGELSLAERGIILVDEIDKLKRRDFGGQSDVGCEAIQQAMLALLDGCEAMPRCRGGDRIRMRSHNVTFVGTGAFVGLTVEPGSVPAAALIADGFIPEFVARWSMRIRLFDVDRALLRKIVLGSNSALNKLNRLFAIHGIEFQTDDKAIDRLIDQASTEGIGARGLNEALWTRLNGLIAEIPQMLSSGVRRVVVDPAALEGLPAWKIPGDAAALPESTAALLHPVKAAESVDTSDWTDNERMSRIDYLLHVRLNFSGLESQARDQFLKYLREFGGEANYSERVRLCESMAFDLTPPCTIPEFLSAVEASEST